ILRWWLRHLEAVLNATSNGQVFASLTRGRSSCGPFHNDCSESETRAAGVQSTDFPSMTLWYFFLILFASILAGMMNSVAGGDTLITFPLLVWIGVDPILANTTCTVALWPGSLGAMVGFRHELGDSRRWMLLLGMPSVAGGLIGAALLLLTPTRLFA